jgi:hypothetical protein
MDSKGKVPDERAGIAQPFVFASTEPEVIAALEEFAQFFLELRQAIGKEGVGKRQPDPRPKFFRKRLAFGPENRCGNEDEDNDQARDSRE